MKKKKKKKKTILTLKQPNLHNIMLAIYKYSKRLLTSTLLPEALSSNVKPAQRFIFFKGDF